MDAKEGTVAANTEALQALEHRLRVIQDIFEEVRNEVGWLANNLNEHQPEEVRCMECERTIRGLAEALRLRWNELTLYQGQYMGMCPDCLQAYEDRAEATRRMVTPEEFQREADAENAQSEAEAGTLACAKAQPATEDARLARGQKHLF